MKLYVYADESGVFDKTHDDLFVYGGVIVPASCREDSVRQYLAAIALFSSQPVYGEHQFC